jgi:multidrug efflux pump subunit AcrA (membrane-fusion protein)
LALKARRKILIAGIIGAAVLTGVVVSFAWRNVRATNGLVAQVPAQTAARPLELISAELYVMKPRALVDTVRFTGTTQPIDQTIVKGRVAGRLAEVLVREGDKVVKDQLLARFEIRELQAKVDERQSALDAARADARWAERDLTEGNPGQPQHRIASGSRRRAFRGRQQEVDGGGVGSAT